MHKNTHGRPQGQRVNQGFTLVELLVVVSIIALLLGILLPSLAGAREAANGLVCKANLRGLAQAQTGYYTDNQGDLAGSPGTTGRALLNDPRAAQGNAEEVNGLATQPWDWAGPLAYEYISDGGAPPVRRSERFVVLNGTDGRSDATSRGGPFPMLACPSQRMIAAPFVQGAVQQGGTDEFPVTLAFSYASARDILWGSGLAPNRSVPRPNWARDGFWGGAQPGAYAPSNAISTSWTLPGESGYRPNIDKLASPSSKVFLSDGTRFQRADLNVIDHDTDSNAGFGGAFADLGGWDPGNSRTLPVGRNAAGQNMSGVSFRHAPGAVDGSGDAAFLRGNVAYYDASVRDMTINEARRPDPWLPSGALIIPGMLVPEIREEYQARVETGLRIPRFRVP